MVVLPESSFEIDHAALAYRWCRGCPHRTRATCSLVILDAARASRAKRPTASGLVKNVGSRNLMATFVSRWMWRAATTTPMPPDPKTLSGNRAGCCGRLPARSTVRCDDISDV